MALINEFTWLLDTMSTGNTFHSFPVFPVSSPQATIVQHQSPVPGPLHRLACRPTAASLSPRSQLTRRAHHFLRSTGISQHHALYLEITGWNGFHWRCVVEKMTTEQSVGVQSEMTSEQDAPSDLGWGNIMNTWLGKLFWLLADS